MQSCVQSSSRLAFGKIRACEGVGETTGKMRGKVWELQCGPCRAGVNSGPQKCGCAPIDLTEENCMTALFNERNDHV